MYAEIICLKFGTKVSGVRCKRWHARYQKDIRGIFFLLENVTFTENNGNPIVRPLVCCSNTSLIEQLADLRCEAYQEMCVKLGMVAGGVN